MTTRRAEFFVPLRLNSHAPKRKATSIPDFLLSRWFSALWPMAQRHRSLLEVASATAKELLANQRDVVVLHGDIHHGNVLDSV